MVLLRAAILRQFLSQVKFFVKQLLFENMFKISINTVSCIYDAFQFMMRFFCCLLFVYQKVNFVEALMIICCIE